MRQRPSQAGSIAVVGVVVVAAALFIGVGWYQLAPLEHAVDAQLGSVQDAYQRRADLGTRLVGAARSAASFPAGAYEPVLTARNAVESAQGFAAFAAAQDRLGSALLRLMTAVEQSPLFDDTYPTLQALVNAETRIGFARGEYNGAASAFNAKRNAMPARLVARLFGSRFNEKPSFPALGAEAAIAQPLQSPSYLAKNYRVPQQHPALTAEEAARIRAMLARVKPCQRAFLRYAFPSNGGGMVMFFLPHPENGTQAPSVLGEGSLTYKTDDGTAEAPPPAIGEQHSLQNEIDRADCGAD